MLFWRLQNVSHPLGRNMSAEPKRTAGSLSSVECPACHQLVVLELINQHLDRCVEAAAEARASPADQRPAAVNNSHLDKPPNSANASKVQNEYVKNIYSC